MLKRGGKLLISFNNFREEKRTAELLKIVVIFVKEKIVIIVENNRCLYVETTCKHLLKRGSADYHYQRVKSIFLKIFQNRQLVTFSQKKLSTLSTAFIVIVRFIYLLIII